MTMKELINLRVLAAHNILVNGVKLIDAIFMNAKMVGLVLSMILMEFQHLGANVLKLITVQFVKSWLVPAIFLVIIVEHVKMIFVTAPKRMESQNITVKVVICLLLAMVIHVRMVENAPSSLKQMLLRHDS